MLAAARRWADAQPADHPELVRLGVFGSYARGDAGFGSDLDLVAVVRDADRPFERRAARWNLNSLPVPADILVYTDAEFRTLQASESRFARVLRDEIVWLVQR
ncbi:MAG TPA: nucleotidyltransferase domain-containing protein [Gemmatimonadaceae bacterium]|nr:nucleotidyltransferase domain-containing protein [Gemmatimonadaceae bacterium]